MAIVTVALLLTSGIASAAPAPDAPVREEGTFPREFLGGGDYVMARAPDGDSWIAVVHGNSLQGERTPVTVVASWTRTLGGAEVHDAAGKTLNRSRPLAVRSLLVHRFGDIYEFNDSNADGIASVARSDQPLDLGQLVAGEAVYKAVSLRQAWSRGPVTETTTTDNGTQVRDIEFNLTAADLDYAVIGSPSQVDPSPGDGKLNRLTFTFHLKAFRTESTVQVPFFNLTIESATPPRVNLTRLPDRTYNTTTLSSTLKVDNLIEGWDPDPQNANPRLLLGTETLLGWAPLPGVASWANDELVRAKLGGGGKALYIAEGGKEVIADSSSNDLKPGDAPVDADEMPKKVAALEVVLADNWERCGRLGWSADVQTRANDTSQPEAGLACYQLQAARKFSIVTDRGAFNGLFLLGGLSYPAGTVVYQDPDIGVDMGNVEIPEFGPPPNNPPNALITSPKPGQTFSPDDSVKLDGSASTDRDGDNLTYVWTEGTGTIGTSAIISKQFSEGTHQLTLTVSDGRAGFDNATVSFNVKREKKQPGFELGAAALSLLAALGAIGRRRRGE